MDLIFLIIKYIIAFFTLMAPIIILWSYFKTIDLNKKPLFNIKILNQNFFMFWLWISLNFLMWFVFSGVNEKLLGENSDYTNWGGIILMLTIFLILIIIPYYNFNLIKYKVKWKDELDLERIKKSTVFLKRELLDNIFIISQFKYIIKNEGKKEVEKILVDYFKMQEWENNEIKNLVDEIDKMKIGEYIKKQHGVHI